MFATFIPAMSTTNPSPISLQLSKLEDMNDALWDDAGLGASLSALRTSIEEGIQTYGIVNITTITDVFAEDWR